MREVSILPLCDSHAKNGGQYGTTILHDDVGDNARARIEVFHGIVVGLESRAAALNAAGDVLSVVMVNSSGLLPI